MMWVAAELSFPLFVVLFHSFLNNKWHLDILWLFKYIATTIPYINSETNPPPPLSILFVSI